MKKSASSLFSRHAVSRADLLRLQFQVGLDAETAAALTGFRVLPPVDVSVGLMSATATLKATLSATPAETPAPRLPLWRAIGPVVNEVDENASQAPAWIARASPLRQADLSAKSYRAIKPTSLLPRSRLGPLLRRLLGVDHESSRLHEHQLVNELARGHALVRLPRRSRLAWAPRVQLYWDQDPVLHPLLDDQREVVQHVRRWRGTHGLEELIVDQNGRALWYPSSGRKSRAPSQFKFQEPRRPRLPDRGTAVLALSDLGCVRDDRERQQRWSRLSRRLNRHGPRLQSLVLCPQDRWRGEIAHAWHAIAWERARLGADHASGTKARVDQVLALLSKAVRIEPALLRAVRKLVAGSDTGTEIDVWMDRRVNRFIDHMTLDPEAALALQGAFEKETPALQREAERLIERYHRSLSEVQRARELVRFGDPKAQKEGNRILESYAKRLKDLPEPPGPCETAHLGRWEERLPQSAWRNPVNQAVWGFGFRKDDGSGFEKPLPEGLSLEQVAWVLATESEESFCYLWQQGNTVRLMLGGLAHAPDDELLPGSALGWLPLRIRQVQLEWTTRAGERRVRLLDANHARPLELPDADDLSPNTAIRVTTDRGRVDLVLEEHPPWAETFERNSEGLQVTLAAPQLAEPPTESPPKPAGFLSRLFGRQRDPAPLAPIIHNPRGLFWPTWARRLDRDAFGLFAELELGDGVATRLRWVPPGQFLMGSPENEAGRYDDEGPQHLVTLTAGFWLGESPCTQAEWRAVMGTEPSNFKGGAQPVEQVGWEECTEFCKRLRARLPTFSARLPTEAEWEYACRAGTTSAYNDGSACTIPEGKDPALLELGWFDGNSNGETHPVQQLKPNSFGLYDMHGNVWEWCADWFGEYSPEAQTDPRGPDVGHGRVFRGGCWFDPAGLCRSAYRSFWRPAVRDDFLGFRLAAGQPRVSEEARAGAEHEGGEAEPRSGGLGEQRGGTPRRAAIGNKN